MPEECAYCGDVIEGEPINVLIGDTQMVVCSDACGEALDEQELDNA